MSLTHSPKIVTDGLVMYYDMPNGKSFVGAPVTNTLDNPSINGYPTYGNGWGTYNTNQYNNNTYFSIGTIASISSNIVTTTAAHPLFSYSVVTPQSSGGGLTAGTNYLIKKLSSTTFTIHAYNGSQDGSQGYINPTTGTHKVFDDFANDVRISVSASGFPTMWWGPPHTPNSCLVKEIIPGGFTGILGRAVTDCIRLHWIQPDGVTDGMAYGPNGAVVAGQVYTVSFWTRSVTPSAVGQSLSYQIYNHGVVSPVGYSFGAVLGPVGVWTKQSMTFTPVNPNCISYFFPSTGNMKVDVANIQFEVGSIANNFVAGTRGTTEVIKDLTGNNVLTANSLTYASDSTFSFNNSTDYISAPVITDSMLNSGSWTLSSFVKFTSVNKGADNAIAGHGSAASSSGLHLGERSALPYFGLYANDLSGTKPLAANTWYEISYIFDYTTKLKTIYVNGVYDTSGGSVGYSGAGSNFEIGRYPWSTGYKLHGRADIVRFYNRALSAAEVKQNFNALRGRYSL